MTQHEGYNMGKLKRAVERLESRLGREATLEQWYEHLAVPVNGVLHDAVGLWTKEEVRDVQMAKLAVIKKRYEDELNPGRSRSNDSAVAWDRAQVAALPRIPSAGSSPYASVPEKAITAGLRYLNILTDLEITKDPVVLYLLRNLRRNLKTARVLAEKKKAKVQRKPRREAREMAVAM